MFNLNFKHGKTQLKLEVGMKNSSAPSQKVKDSKMNQFIDWSLGLATAIGIWKYLILPLLSIL